MVHVASYHFDEFITDPARKVIEDREIILVLGDHDNKEAQAGIKTGEIIANSVNKARHWIDLPPVTMHPSALADKAEKISKEHGLTFTVFNEKEINQMGMGGLSAVSRGSDLDCQLVLMEYKSANKNAPTIAFVGKGITFDSGGLSIKPANHMETMKEDMSGAAAVIATMEALGQLKPDVNVIGVAPIAENLPSGKAAKPGDIVRFYNGKTAEIKNTDAEGRLILADALAYVVKHHKPVAVIDVATLTGSCAHALGPFYCGLMSNHDELVTKLQESSERSGDKVWRLPLTDDYKPAIKSPVADISNIGSPTYMAGAITAALFLQNFVDDVPWVHLDIAGTAFDVPDLPYYRPHSATGFGVRLLVDVAMNWEK
jgi:leucyl aminopeptidase